MKAHVKHVRGEGNVDILDVEEPSCGPDQVKVEGRVLRGVWDRYPRLAWSDSHYLQPLPVLYFWEIQFLLGPARRTRRIGRTWSCAPTNSIVSLRNFPCRRRRSASHSRLLSRRSRTWPQARIGDTALVSGPGPMGLLCLKLARGGGSEDYRCRALGDEARSRCRASFWCSHNCECGQSESARRSSQGKRWRWCGCCRRMCRPRFGARLY